MNIEQIMRRPAITCRAHDSLSAPAQLMWDYDCGSVAVTDDEGRLIGVITDRDICMATHTHGSAPASISVSDVMAHEVFTAHPNDPLHKVEQLMSQKQVRRIPIVDDENRPIGMLSLNDIARYVASVRGSDGTDKELTRTLAAICAPRAQGSGQSGLIQQSAAE